MSTEEGRLTRIERRTVAFLREHPFAIGSTVFILSVLAIWLLPEWQVINLKSMTAPARFEAENSARVTIAQTIGGLLLLVGLYFTWWRIEEGEETRIASQKEAEETRRLIQEGQITDRFTRAIEQLGSDKLELRLGAIYALERIARDSERDHWPIMEILTAFVRERSSSPVKTLPHRWPDPDIQATLTVLGRRMRIYGHGENKALDLRGADLRHADLQGAHLEGAFLYEANLHEAILYDAHLRKADLIGANLSDAKLGNADLRGAYLWRANMERAELTAADVTGADFGVGLGEAAQNLKSKQILCAKGVKDPLTKLPPTIREYLANIQGEGTLGSAEDALAKLKDDS